MRPKSPLLSGGAHIQMRNGSRDVSEAESTGLHDSLGRGESREKESCPSPVKPSPRAFLANTALTATPESWPISGPSDGALGLESIGLGWASP